MCLACSYLYYFFLCFLYHTYSVLFVYSRLFRVLSRVTYIQVHVYLADVFIGLVHFTCVFLCYFLFFSFYLKHWKFNNTKLQTLHFVYLCFFFLPAASRPKPSNLIRIVNKARLNMRPKDPRDFNFPQFHPEWAAHEASTIYSFILFNVNTIVNQLMY